MRFLLPLAAILTLIMVSTARADEWCGFLDKKGAPVRCGFSSLAQCRQSLGDKKEAVCMPSPSFANGQHAFHLAARRS